MIDSVSIKIRSGDGGDGAISGRREKYVPRGGPDGGDGGDGGSVRIISDSSVRSLSFYRYRRRFVASDGKNGVGRRKHGSNGDDVALRVPEGTVVTLQDPVGETSTVDLQVPAQEVFIEGGRGGRGNARFATATNRFPLLAEQGGRGREFTAVLDLKLIADVGIIGQPNAGKSSLLTALTAARPKVAAYPFSTIEPALGVIEHREERVVLVDIPGLIEGAHAGVGLGHEFLRHIERTVVLVHVVDGTLDEPVAEYQRVRDELDQYGEGLSDKLEVVALNKSDMPGVDEKLGTLAEALKGRTVHCISAATGSGLGPMMDSVLAALGNPQADDPVPAEDSCEPAVLRPRAADDRVRIDRKGKSYVVHADRPGRIAAMVDPSDWEARAQLYGYLENAGVLSALRKAGAGPGDPFQLGGKEWSWD